MEFFAVRLRTHPSCVTYLCLDICEKCQLCLSSGSKVHRTGFITNVAFRICGFTIDYYLFEQRPQVFSIRCSKSMVQTLFRTNFMNYLFRKSNVYSKIESCINFDFGGHYFWYSFCKLFFSSILWSTHRL